MNGSRIIENISGMKFGRLTVLRFNGVVKGKYKWVVECDCGVTKLVSRSVLIGGTTISCGCAHKEMVKKMATKHGEAGKKEYTTWMHIKGRCHRPTDAGFKDYGGRGIKVCSRWRYSFEAFLSDMGRAPSAKHSIDRIDNNKGYEPSNCRWVTQIHQCNNTRRNIFIEYNGEKMTVMQWSRKLGINDETIRGRIKSGWPPILILSTNKYKKEKRTALERFLVSKEL